MNKYKQAFLKVEFLALFTWLFFTLFIDFFLVPTTFRTLGTPAIAGPLAIKFFAFFNILEFSIGMILVITEIVYKNRARYNYHVGIVALLFIIAAAYLFYISPQIVKYGSLMESTSIDSNMLKSYIDNHQFFHKLYVKIDSVKLLLLMALALVSFRNTKIELKQKLKKDDL